MNPQPKSAVLPIIEALDDLAMRLPDLHAEYPEPGSRMEAFAAQADPILDHAAVLDRFHGADDCREMAAARIVEMLEAAGWVDADGNVLD